MVVVGGLTRLTDSGLSITEWRPVTGVVPPIDDADWEAEFAKYRTIPEYALVNRGMSLAEFKTIYWWEWAHRFIGRLVGVAYLVPLLFFWATGRIAPGWLPRLILIFLLGGAQGALGWWMVQSGLSERVDVSQYRLAAHLGLAFIIMGALVWTALEYARPERRFGRLPAGAAAFLGLVFFQIVLGAFVAGLDAGFVYNTWPSMDGRFLPEGAFFESPWWINFFENPGLVQFNHRAAGYAAGAAAVALWLRAPARRTAQVVLGLTAVQIVLGIVTVVTGVPLALGAVHQAGAAALFAAAVWHLYESSRQEPPSA